MSYDLYFFAPTGRSIADSEILAYFKGRPHYKLNKSQALYENEDTGVYFSFDVGSEPFEAMEDGEPGPPSIVHFNLNFFRPHIFGLEAEPEVAALVQAFGLPLHDPQIGGMGSGPYSREGFLQGWNAGNEVGYQSVLTAHGKGAAEHTLPTAVIESCWAWNRARASQQARFRESLFVPKIMFLVVDGGVRRVVAWPDAIPVTLPEVDYYIIGRKEFAPRRFIFAKQDMALASRDQVEAVVGKYRRLDGPIPYRLLHYDRQPAALVDWVRSLSPHQGQFQGIPVEKTLNAELVAKYLPLH